MYIMNWNGTSVGDKFEQSIQACSELEQSIHACSELEQSIHACSELEQFMSK